MNANEREALECGDLATCHRFLRLADLSARQSRVQRLAESAGHPLAFDGDKSPAKSADKSAHSKACGETRRL